MGKKKKEISYLEKNLKLNLNHTSRVKQLS